MTGSPLSSVNSLKAQLSNLTWTELKKELSTQYSAIPFDSHATQAFAQLEQGPDELLDMYLHHSSELLSNIYHTSDLSTILAEDLNHYTVVYGLNGRRLQNSVVEHQSMQWKKMEDCFRIFVILVLGMKELNAMAELSTTHQKHLCSLGSKQ